MPKYTCPVITCRFTFSGSLDDIIPPAVGHAAGSHQQNFTDQNIITIVNRQADPNYRKGEIMIQPKKYKKHRHYNKEKKVHSNLRISDIEKEEWWKKMGQK